MLQKCEQCHKNKPSPPKYLSHYPKFDKISVSSSFLGLDIIAYLHKIILLYNTLHQTQRCDLFYHLSKILTYSPFSVQLSSLLPGWLVKPRSNLHETVSLLVSMLVHQ